MKCVSGCRHHARNRLLDKTAFAPSTTLSTTRPRMHGCLQRTLKEHYGFLGVGPGALSPTSELAAFPVFIGYRYCVLYQVWSYRKRSIILCWLSVRQMSTMTPFVSTLLAATLAVATLMGNAAAAAQQIPVSATAQDITADDPVGLGRLKVRARR